MGSTLPLHHLILEAVDELTDWIVLEIHEIEITEEGSVMVPAEGVVALVTEEMGVVLVIAAEVGLEIDAGDLIKKNPALMLLTLFLLYTGLIVCTCTILNIRK